MENSANFDKNFENVLRVAQTIIEINANLYGNYTKIIIEQPPVLNPPSNMPTGANVNLNPGVNVPPNPQAPGQQQRPVPNAADRGTRADLHRQGGPPTGATVPTGHPTQPNQAFNINPNTFIDDEEYGLNVEDFDMEIKTWS